MLSYTPLCRKTASLYCHGDNSLETLAGLFMPERVHLCERVLAGLGKHLLWLGPLRLPFEEVLAGKIVQLWIIYKAKLRRYPPLISCYTPACYPSLSVVAT